MSEIECNCPFGPYTQSGLNQLSKIDWFFTVAAFKKWNNWLFEAGLSLIETISIDIYTPADMVDPMFLWSCQKKEHNQYGRVANAFVCSQHIRPEHYCIYDHWQNISNHWQHETPQPIEIQKHFRVCFAYIFAFIHQPFPDCVMTFILY